MGVFPADLLKAVARGHAIALLCPPVVYICANLLACLVAVADSMRLDVAILLPSILQCNVKQRGLLLTKSPLIKVAILGYDCITGFKSWPAAQAVRRNL